MISRCVVIAFTLQIVAVYAQITPIIHFISSKQIRDIGGIAELKCSVLHRQDYLVLWVKSSSPDEDPIIISSGTALIIRESRFSLHYDVSASTYTLQIKDVQETDRGMYLCQVWFSTTMKISGKVELQVRKPPYISDNSSRSACVSEGRAVELYCYADGLPTPKISWRREYNSMLPTGGIIHRGNILKISSIHKEDRGAYFCVAENGAGRGAIRRVNIEVEYAPVITVGLPRVEQALGYNMDLECHIETFPSPSILWLKDGEVLFNNQHYSISRLSTSDEYTDTTLRVITIERKQYGEYVCKATNKLGSAETKIELSETAFPVCPPACIGVLSKPSGSLVTFQIVAAIFRYINTRD